MMYLVYLLNSVKQLTGLIFLYSQFHVSSSRLLILGDNIINRDGTILIDFYSIVVTLCITCVGVQKFSITDCRTSIWVSE
jgi:hypothetical protein